MSNIREGSFKTAWGRCRRIFLSFVLSAVMVIGSIPMISLPAVSAVTIGPGDSDGKFTIAILPDTQQEVIGSAVTNQLFKNRMQWLVNNQDNLDLRFVTHTGDMVNWGVADPAQFTVASDAYEVLDTASIPYNIALGNHDTAAVGVGGSAADPPNTSTLVRVTTTFNSYFPNSRFPGITCFESGKEDNSYMTFTAAGKKWLMMTLELWPRTVAINWAKTVVEDHPDYNVMISTHSYLTSSGTIGTSNGGYGANSPQYLYDNLIKVYPNIRFVFSGHEGTAARREDTGVNGNKIVSILGCFHESTRNPVQLLEIDVNAGTAHSTYYSPYDNYTWTTHERTFTNLNYVNPIADPAIVAYNWEFNTAGDTEGWTAAQKISNFTTANGTLNGMANNDTTPYDARIKSPVGLQLDPAYSILKFRSKITNPNFSAFSGGSAYFNRTSDGTTISGSRTVNFPSGMTVQGNAGFVEYSIDLSTHASWNEDIYNLWIDPIRGPNGTTMEIDYIRLYKKGSYTLTYNANASGGSVTGMPLNDSTVAAGTGYLLSGQIPVRSGYVFLGWSESQYGSAVNSVDITGNKTVYALWVPNALVGYSAEFATAGDTEGWVIANGIASMTSADGALKIETTAKDGRINKVFTNIDNSDGNEPHNSAYNLMRIRYKKPVTAATGILRWQRVGDTPPVGTADVVAAEQANRKYSYTFANSAASTDWYETTYDLSANANWNGAIRTIWIDAVERTDASSSNHGIIDYDYIRFYRKGTTTVTYNKNTTDTVTKMPDNDTMAAIGTGYLLSGQIPERTGYVFLGWSATQSGSVIKNNSIDISGNVTVYAKWRSTNQVAAFFDIGDAQGTAPADVIVTKQTSFTLPSSSGITKTGYTFAGWFDGTSLYAAGANYTMGTADIRLNAVWNMQAPTFLPTNGAANVDFRNLSVQITFPVAMDVATLTTDRISSTWAQSVAYNATTRVLTVYLKPQNLKYSTTVSFTTGTGMMSADHTLALPATSYSFTTRTTQPEDGENLVSNGNFELPFISAYFVDSMVFSTDTPSGTGSSLQVNASATGLYTQPKFNIYYKPGSVYYYEYDTKVLSNYAGDTAATSQVLYAAKLNAGSDVPINNPFPTAQKQSDGWKHITGYTDASAQYPNFVTGNVYAMIYTNPYNSLGTSFLLDNVVVKEAYAVTFAGGNPGGTVSGSVASIYRPKNGSLILPSSGFTCPGYTMTGWTDGTTTYALGASFTVPQGGKALTAVWATA